MRSSSCGEYQDYLVDAVFQHEGMAAEFVAPHLLQRIEIGDLLAHNGSGAGNLRDTFEFESQAAN